MIQEKITTTTSNLFSQTGNRFTDRTNSISFTTLQDRKMPT
jgi:hypothetical protein